MTTLVRSFIHFNLAKSCAPTCKLKKSSSLFQRRHLAAVKELPWSTPGMSRTRAQLLETNKNKNTNANVNANQIKNEKISFEAPKAFGIIAAMSQNRIIGVNGQLPFHVPTDRRYFEQITSQKVLIVGKHTFLESKHGHHVQHVRCLIVVSKTLMTEKYGCNKNNDSVLPEVHFVSSFEEALHLAQELSSSHHDSNINISVNTNTNHEDIDIDIDCWIGGGERIYEEALRHASAYELHLTHVNVHVLIQNDSHTSSDDNGSNHYYVRFPPKYRYDQKFEVVNEWKTDTDTDVTHDTITTIDMNTNEEASLQKEPSCHFLVYRRKQRPLSSSSSI